MTVRVFAILLSLLLVIPVLELSARGRGGGGRGGGRPSMSRSGPASHGSMSRGPSRSSSMQRGGTRSRQGSRPERVSTRPDRPGDRPDRPGDRPEDRPGQGDRQDFRQDQAQDRQDFRQNAYSERSDFRDEVREHHEWWHDRYRYGVGVTLTSASYRALTCSSTTIVAAGITYYSCGSTWYQRRYSGGSVTYIVVNAPSGY